MDHYLLLMGLKKAGVKPSEIQLQNLEMSVAAAAFVDGQFDAVAVFAPFTEDALKRPGSKVLFSSKDFPATIADPLFVNRQFAENRSQDVQKLINTWFAALKFIREHPEKTDPIMAKRAALSVAEYKKLEAGTKILSLEENLQAFSPGQTLTSLPYAAQEVSNFLLENNLIQKQPDLTRLFDDKFLKAYASSLNSKYSK